MNDQKKLPPEQRQICALIQGKEGGSEVKVVARESFLKIGDDGKTTFDTEPDRENGFGIKLKPDDAILSFDRKKIQKLYENKTISLETYNALLEMLDSQDSLFKAARGPGFTFESQDTSKALDQMAAIRNLLSIDELCNASNNAARNRIAKNKRINPETSFAPPSVLMDRIKYIPELLNQSVLKRIGETYKVTSNITVDDLGKIGLEYTLKISDKYKTPEAAFKKYIEDMHGAALKVFLSYWLHAYDHGSYMPESTSLTDIINGSVDPTRQSWISSSEKKRFWALSELLKDTSLTITFKINKEECTVKHPMLTVPITVSKTRELEIRRGYPDKVCYGVLDPDKFKEKANLATEISKGTVKLPPEDIMLAITFQVRASQTRQKEGNTYDKAYLKQMGCLQGTNVKNPTEANKKLKSKLARIKDADAIGEFSDQPGDKILIKKRKSNL